MVLTPDEVEIVTREVNGIGGAQLLLRYKILPALDRVTGELTLEDVVLQKVHQYAWKYGGGGYEDRFRAIENAAFRAGWVAP